MYVIRQCAQTVREFGGIRVPISDTARPPQIYSEQLHSEVGGNVGVAAQGQLVDLLLVSPRVPRYVGKALGFGDRPGEHRFNKTLCAVGRLVPIAVKQADE